MQGYPFAFHQALGALDIIGGSCMSKGFKPQSIVFIPLTGADVILGYLSKCQALSEALTKQIPKKMVIAVPMPLVVQGTHEQVGVFEVLQVS